MSAAVILCTRTTVIPWREARTVCIRIASACAFPGTSSDLLESRSTAASIIESIDMEVAFDLVIDLMQLRQICYVSYSLRCWSPLRPVVRRARDQFATAAAIYLISIEFRLAIGSCQMWESSRATGARWCNEYIYVYVHIYNWCIYILYIAGWLCRQMNKTSQS